MSEGTTTTGLVVLALAVALLIWVALKWPWLARLAARFVSGRPMDGKPRTDSQFLLAGTRSLTGLRRPSRWSLLPGWKRAAWRLGILGAFVTWPVATAAGYGRQLQTVAAVAVAAGGLLVSWRTWLALRRWRHERDWVRPLHHAVAPLLALPARTSPASYLTVPLDIHTNPDATVRVDLPDTVAAEPGTKKLLELTIPAKLALDDPDFHWRVAGRAPHLLIRQAPQPPKRVTLEDLREAIEKALDTAPVIGLGVRRSVHTVDLRSDSPHVLASMGTGGGKSTFARLVTAQTMARAGVSVVLDLKRVSHMWMRGLPGVAYCRDIQDIHDGLIAVAAEGDRRFRLMDDAGDESVLDPLPRVTVVLEEINATANRLQKYWAEIRQPSDPKASPAVTALGDVLFMGRQAKIHVVVVGQMVTARSLGGPEARENFSTRVLSRYTQNTARMLAPEVKFPAASRVIGRAQVYRGGEVHAVQLGYITDDEARELVLGAQRDLGLELPANPGVEELLGAAAEMDVIAALHRAGALTATAGSQPALFEVPSPRPSLRLVSSGTDGAPPWGTAPTAALRLQGRTSIDLVEACSAGGPLEGMTIEVLRKARQRDPEFPQTVGREGTAMLYRIEDLLRWARNRPKAPYQPTEGAPPSGADASDAPDPTPAPGPHPPAHSELGPHDPQGEGLGVGQGEGGAHRGAP